jgi:hypothetical protein
MTAQDCLRASDRAQTVVGLYGDPTVSWSIILEARLLSSLDPLSARERLCAAVEKYPHLGAQPRIEPIVAADLPVVRERFAAAPYGRGEPLLRVAVCADEPVILVAAHHGALDGLGLLAVLGIAVDVPISSGAQGIGARTADRSFVASAMRRLCEAVFAPPARIAPAAAAEDLGGDVFVARHGTRARLGAADLVAAATRVSEGWNTAHGAKTTRVVAAVGASCRSGAAVVPEHDSGFFRLRLQREPSADDVRTLLTETNPEPDFPARSSKIARLVTRALASRLGSTFLVSNLGVVSAGDAVRSIAFYPAASGRSGVAFGAATVGETSTFTIRARRKDFGATAAAELVDELVYTVRGEDSRPGSGQPGDIAHQ